MISSCLPASQPVCLPACQFHSFPSSTYTYNIMIHTSGAVMSPHCGHLDIQLIIMLIENFTSIEVQARALSPNRTRTRAWKINEVLCVSQLPHLFQINNKSLLMMGCDALMIIYCEGINLSVCVRVCAFLCASICSKIWINKFARHWINIVVFWKWLTNYFRIDSDIILY